MEHAIQTLLNDFEHGKLNRRQLIKHLAMVATVASPVAVAAQGAPAQAPWNTVHLFKSYHVLDPDGWDLQISNQTKQG